MACRLPLVHWFHRDDCNLTMSEVTRHLWKSEKHPKQIESVKSEREEKLNLPISRYPFVSNECIRKIYVENCLLWIHFKNSYHWHYFLEIKYFYFWFCPPPPKKRVLTIGCYLQSWDNIKAEFFQDTIYFKHGKR